jgi:phage shock protein C
MMELEKEKRPAVFTGCVEETEMERRLYRSRTNRFLAGVCGGMANYFNIDPTIVRVLAIIALLVFNIMAVIAYLIFIIIIPLENPANTNIQPTQRT